MKAIWSSKTKLHCSFLCFFFCLCGILELFEAMQWILEILKPSVSRSYTVRHWTLFGYSSFKAIHFNTFDLDFSIKHSALVQDENPDLLPFCRITVTAWSENQTRAWKQDLGNVMRWEVRTEIRTLKGYLLFKQDIRSYSKHIYLSYFTDVSSDLETWASLQGLTPFSAICHDKQRHPSYTHFPPPSK